MNNNRNLIIKVMSIDAMQRRQNDDQAWKSKCRYPTAFSCRQCIYMVAQRKSDACIGKLLLRAIACTPIVAVSGLFPAFNEKLFTHQRFAALTDISNQQILLHLFTLQSLTNVQRANYFCDKGSQVSHRSYFSRELSVMVTEDERHSQPEHDSL